jgi:DNA-directed RNA polymerase subunit RPC12/RpoP
MVYLTSSWEAVKSFIAKALGIKTVAPVSQPSTPAAREIPVQKAPGLDCPQCGFRIMISVPMLLSGGPIFCPACSLKLTIDQEQSRACLNELQKVYNAIQRVEEVKLSGR